MNNETNRIPSLDGLRAVSIALVVLSHLLTVFGFKLTSVGNLGVRVFFVISGFLITSILVGEIEKTSSLNLKKFYFRRILRIFPAYYFYVFFLLFLTATVVYKISGADFLASFLYASNYYLPVSWELGHTWSLSIEEQFYLLFPGILLFQGIEKTKKFLLFVLIAAPFVGGFYVVVSYFAATFGINAPFLFGFTTNMDVLASGCLLALYRKNLRGNRFYQKLQKPFAPISALIFIVFFVAFGYDLPFLLFVFGLSAMNLSITLLVDWLITNHQNSFGQILNSKPFVFVGTMSYSLYLWQQPFSEYKEEFIWTHYPLNIALIIVFSLFSYYVVEKTFLRWRQRTEKNLFDENPVKAVPQTN